ncbi:MAG: hypothetical protein MRJ92_01945 [Nitrospira sp.]|nr:hypothetical protein [Nitrospira sp.]
MAEALALVVKVFSGVVSDYLGRRKELAVFGYALGALTKPLFVTLAPNLSILLTARLVDQVGKGFAGRPVVMRWWRISAPRRCAAQRFRVASIAGYGRGISGPCGRLMLLWADDFRAVFWVAVVPVCWRWAC